MQRPSFTECANRHGSDKGTLGPSAGWGGNNFADVYEGLFLPLRDRALHILEIGLGVPGPNWQAHIAHGRNAEGGGSIKALHEYFPAAELWGVDINPATHLDRERLRTAQVDQGDPASWAAFLAKTSGAPFDLIIDDGSHRPDHQQVSLDVLWPHLAPGGIFIVEDLMDNGRGDGSSAQSRHRADEVVSTRRLLKGLAETGQLEGPHALSDPERLAAETASVTFHAPVISAPAPRLLRQIVTDTLRGRPVQFGRHVSYLEGSERVAILRKTA